MNCKKCGKPISEDIGYCSECRMMESSADVEIQKEQISEVDNEKIKEEEKSELSIDSSVKPVTNAIVMGRSCQCGQKLNSAWKCCPKCGVSVVFETDGESSEVTVTSVKKENITVYIIIYSIGILLFVLFGILALLIPLITIITAKINCPNSVVIKVLFWITIFFSVVFFTVVIILIMMCNNIMNDCASSAPSLPR